MSDRARADRVADELRKLSEDTADTVVASLRERVETATRTLTALWITEFGDVSATPGLGERSVVTFAQSAVGTIGDALDPLVLDEDTLAKAERTAYTLGVEHGVRTAPSPVQAVVPSPARYIDVRSPVAEQATEAMFAVSRSSVAANGYTAVTKATADARKAVTRVEATVATEIVTSATTGTVDVARQTGSPLVWIAERDGCLHCLAYSGQTTATTFDPYLSFDERALGRGHVLGAPLAGPPLHPNCRCVTELWDPKDVGFVEGLQREARRSVLQGKADASEPAKLRAADRLLELGSGLPKTVESKARRAVRDGRFA